MTHNICVVYYSGYGHTEKLASAVAEGARRVENVSCKLLSVSDLEDGNSNNWQELDCAEAIIFGSPTYMGSVSSHMKKFMEITSDRWQEQKWSDKLAAGFTNSGCQNGDKDNTLDSFVTFAAQHGMIWINLNILPGNNSSTGSVNDLNRLGASIGAMAQSNNDEGPEVVPPEADLETGRRLGQRVAECAVRWNR